MISAHGCTSCPTSRPCLTPCWPLPPDALPCLDLRPPPELPNMVELRAVNAAPALLAFFDNDGDPANGWFLTALRFGGI